jgi:hypothetical protein
VSLRATISRLERSITAVRAAQPPVCMILEPRDDEPAEAWRARLAEAERRIEAVKATGHRGFLIIVDREDEA